MTSSPPLEMALASALLLLRPAHDREEAMLVDFRSRAQILRGGEVSFGRVLGFGRGGWVNRAPSFHRAARFSRATNFSREGAL